MKELLKLAEEKGWRAKTLSTKWTVDCLLGRKKRAFLNEYCESNVLNEIQKWLRESKGLIVTIAPFHMRRLDENLEDEEFTYNSLYSYFIHKRTFFIKDGVDFSTYEECLKQGLIEALNENI